MTAPNPDKPYSALENARAFFERNPDEVLTREDIQVKFGCCQRTAKTVASVLIREGIPRWRLPKGEKARKPKDVLPFPQSLRVKECRAIQAMAKHGSISDAAAALGLTHNSLASYLRDARRKAGVSTTLALVVAYQEATAR